MGHQSENAKCHFMPLVAIIYVLSQFENVSELYSAQNTCSLVNLPLILLLLKIHWGPQKDPGFPNQSHNTDTPGN